MVDGVSRYFNLLIFCMNFILQYNILILDSLHLLFKILQIITEQCNCLLMFFKTLLQLCCSLLMLLLYFLYVIFEELFYQTIPLGFFGCTAFSIEPSKLMSKCTRAITINHQNYFIYFTFPVFTKCFIDSFIATFINLIKWLLFFVT